MTSSKQPHPQRCETCKKYSERTHPIYEGNIIAFCGEERTQVETKAITSNHGCASHSSAAEPAKGVSCLTCFHCHKQVSTYHKGLVFRGTAICPECTDKYGEHDATIAQAAREKVLDDVIKFCETEHSAPLHEETAFRVSRYAKSLRQQEGKP